MAVIATFGAACSSVLGLTAPSLDPCIDGCPDVGATPPPHEDSGTSSGGGSSSGGSSSGGGDSAPAPEASPPDVAVIPDVAIDRGPSDGVRCGSGASEIFCDPSTWCCLLVDDAGTGSYSCTSDQSSCDDLSGYPIQCASNADCAGNDICCVYGSAIKCEPVGTNTCVFVCDPNGSADQCPSGKTCESPSPPFSTSGYPLPYDGCE